MEKNILDLFGNMELHLESGMGMDIQAFFDVREDIKMFELKLNKEGVVIINIDLYHFSYLNAKNIMYNFMDFISYNKRDLLISENIDNKVKFLYTTMISDAQGVKMIITVQ